MILKVLQIRRQVQKVDDETGHVVVMKSLHTGGEMVKEYNAWPFGKTEEYIHYRDNDKGCETSFRKSFCEMKEIESLWTYCDTCKGRINYKQGPIIIFTALKQQGTVKNNCNLLKKATITLEVISRYKQYHA
jgi:hypothetical protein